MNTFWSIIGIIFFIILALLCILSFWLKKGLEILSIVHEPNEVKVGNGNKSAIIVYEPTKHDAATNITMAIAEALSENDYTVTINYPSDDINYNLTEYDLVAFGSGVYVGKFSSVLGNYILKNRFRNKKVLLYTVGLKTEDTTDLKELKILFDETNDIHAIKVKKGQEKKIKDFVNKMINK